MMPEPVLEIKNLFVKLPEGADRAYAVKGVNLSIQPGEIVCLLGESGSGKSVIAHAVMGLLPTALTVSSSSITVLGDDVASMTTEKLEALRGMRMSMIFQEPMTALNPVARCGAQIEEVLIIHGVAAAARRARVVEILRRVHFSEPERVYRSFPHQLSGGQRQRVMIAMALCMEPALLICDEPTTALDVTTQAEILKLLLELRSQTGTAILFITHDIGVAEQIADKVLVMRLGEAVETGTCQQTLRAPKTDYTRMLIGAIPSLEPMRIETTRSEQPVLEVIKLNNAYRQGGWFSKRQETIVADNVNLRIRPGETVGVVGESGSGKSSLARCIARLTEFDAGEIIINGLPLIANRSRRDEIEVRRQVQMVFQDPYRSLNPRRSVLESIIEGPMNLGVSRQAAIEKARRLMERVRLPEAGLNRYPHEFSGGQRQRICIARALACEPKLLIADEAVSALDVSVQAQILDLLEEIQAQFGLAMLFITHDLRVAARLCDRILVMQSGRVVEEGTAQQVLKTPTQPYTRELIAAIPKKQHLEERI